VRMKNQNRRNRKITFLPIVLYTMTSAIRSTADRVPYQRSQK
jgi:hypothetical protein